jgi:hypothetical protein
VPAVPAQRRHLPRRPISLPHAPTVPIDKTIYNQVLTHPPSIGTVPILASEFVLRYTTFEFG